MNSINAMRLEIELQPTELSRIAVAPASSPCTFIGSGDSFAAGLAGQYLSCGRAHCHSPSELIECPGLSQGRDIFIISASGKTRDNLKVARFAKEKSLRTTAITHIPESPLARVCDDVIVLDYKTSGQTTASTLGFTSSMLACSCVANGQTLQESPSTLYENALQSVSEFLDQLDPVGKPITFVAETLYYPAALYGMFKQFEVLGNPSSAYQIDEFCHSPIFGQQESGVTVILAALKKGGTLLKMLKNAGMKAWILNTDNTTSELGASVLCTFFVQMLALNSAEKSGLQECYFTTNKKLLNISSTLIY